MASTAGPRLATGVGLLVLLSGCASVVPPRAGVPERARAARTYSASLRVSLKSATLRGRARALVAFSRPDALRLELPGPAGALCIAVARGASLTAVFPASRATWDAPATAQEMEALLRVRLSPAQLMDLLTGVAPSGVSDYRAIWGEAFPRRVSATLSDGSRLEAWVDSADLDPALSPAVFEAPPSPGYRRVAADEARRLLGIR